MKNLSENSFKSVLKRFWHFFWYEDSFASWLVNIIIAFVVIKFLIYPGLGFILGTPFPIVAVVSESMEHGLHQGILCGQQFKEFPESFDNYWKICGSWYEDRKISKEDFTHFPFSNGFNKGDVIILWRATAKNVGVGDILVFKGDKPQPIIHRVTRVWQENEKIYYQTKGDHNRASIDGGFSEIKIEQERIYGKGIFRLPYLGWIKVWFVKLAALFGITITR